jgi:hypothetical protein
MPTYKLEAIPKPPSNVITMRLDPLYVTRELSPIIQGNGDTNYLCGSCGLVLIASLNKWVRVQGFVLVCHRCFGYNYIRGDYPLATHVQIPAS